MTIIDISRHQGEMDWPRVRHEGGVTCAIIRCSLGSTGIDDRYAENWRESGWAGVPRRGAYHYVITSASAEGQLANILRVTGGDFGSEPITLDVERTSSERAAMAAGWPFPRAAYTNMLFALAHGLRVHVPVSLYTSKWEWEAMTTQPSWAANFPLHVAGYPTDPNSTTYRPLVPAPWQGWTTWQYSSTGRVPGIAGNVDLNRERVLAPVPQPPPADTTVAGIAGHARSILELV